MELLSSLLFLFCTTTTHLRGHALDGMCGRALSSLAVQPWLDAEAERGRKVILEHISPNDAKPGAVIAATTRHDPNYYYHWVRDAGLVLDSLREDYAVADANLRASYRQKFREYVKFSAALQKSPALTGLGEPKFNVDGTPFNEPWGRPQNDSPALRAISLLQWSKVLADEEATLIHDEVYPMILKDLKYVADHWQDPSWDLWEEVKGDHFYTRMVQRRALIEGARLAETRQSLDDSIYFMEQAQKIETDLPTFWDPSLGYFKASKNIVSGLTDKHSQLDTAVILGLLHGATENDLWAANDPKVQATVAKIQLTFRMQYPVNHRDEVKGTAIGRYPEDRYGGANFNGGNPWPLCTLALAEIQYRAAEQEAKAGHRETAQNLIKHGDAFVARVQYHGNPDGSLSEQIDRFTGYMTSVAELTWNSAAILTTNAERKRAEQAVNK